MSVARWCDHRRHDCARPDELPADPDLDDLPAELAAHEGPFTITGVDEDGDVFSAPIAREHLAAGFADKRRLEDDDDAA